MYRPDIGVFCMDNANRATAVTIWALYLACRIIVRVKYIRGQLSVAYRGWVEEEDIWGKSLTGKSSGFRQSVNTKRGGFWWQQECRRYLWNKVNSVFVGLLNSFVIHYIVADDVSPSGKPVFQYNLQGYKQLGLVRNYIDNCVVFSTVISHWYH